MAGMKAAGLGNDNAIDNSQEGWDAGLEVQWAIQQAGNLDETTIMQKLQHLDINTLGIIWNRNPSNYENIQRRCWPPWKPSTPTAQRLSSSSRCQGSSRTDSWYHESVRDEWKERPARTVTF